MEERPFEAIRQLPRNELEAFAVRAALHVRDVQKELEAEGFFVAILTGFILGALVTASGFFLGSSLG